MPNVPIQFQPGPQRAAPKSLHAVSAEAAQVADHFRDASPKKPFLKKLSIEKWKVSAHKVSQQLLSLGTQGI